MVTNPDWLYAGSYWLRYGGSMTTEHTLGELRHAVLEFATARRGDPKELAEAIRGSIRTAQGDPRLVVHLRLLLGDLLHWMGEQDKAGALYTTEDPGLDELHHAVLGFATSGRGDPKELAEAIRRGIRTAKGDLRLVVRLRLLLGDLLGSMGEQDKARAQYRKVLKEDPGSVDAMIRIGRSFESADRLGNARRWYQTAYTAAEEMHDYAGQLAALDQLASGAVWRDDSQALADALDAMCRVLASVPRTEGVLPMIADWLLLKRKGALALPFLRCLVTHVLVRGYGRHGLFHASSTFAEALSQEGHSDGEIRRMLCEFRHLAANEEVATNFEVAIDWAFEMGRTVLRDSAAHWDRRCGEAII